MKNVKMFTRSLWLFIVAAMLSVSCEKVIIEDGKADPASGTNTVTIRVIGAESYVGKDGATRAPVDVTKACTRLCFAVYQDGKRVKALNQKLGDADFGTAEMTLEEGDYQLLILGHNSKSNPTTTNPEKIQFTNATASGGTGYSDTFYYYGDLMLDSNAKESFEYELARATAMFRLMVNDAIPQNVKKFHFYYTGGSGAFDATTGYGCVNSKQTVIIETDATFGGKPTVFELYTFPHEEYKEVKFTVKALDANDDIVHQRDFSNVWMQRNTITQYSGNFFSETPYEPDPQTPDNPGKPASSWEILVDTVWAATNMYTY